MCRGPGFLAVLGFGSSPPPPLSRQQFVSLPKSSCVWPVEITDGIGRAEYGEEPNHTTTRSLVRFKIIQYSLKNTKQTCKKICKIQYLTENEHFKKQSHELKYVLLTKVNYWLHKKKKQLIFGVPDTMIRLYSSFGESGSLRSTTGRLFIL
jgi:hypothetical protein